MTTLITAIAVVLSALVGGIAGASAQWFFGERSRARWKSYLMREEKYARIIKDLWGFYERTLNPDQRRDFIDQVYSLWLYAPDDVYLKAKAFLNALHTAAPKEEAEKKDMRWGELMQAMRKDLISNQPFKKTKLRAEDFKHFGIN